MVSTQGQTPSGLDTESDAEKFTQLYHLYFQPLIWCVKKIVHSDTLAEEIVQETFQRLLRNLGKVDLNQPQRTKAYLVKIAVHIAYDVYSQELKYAPIDITSCQDTLITHSPDPVWEEFNSKGLLSLMQTWISELSEKEQLILRYRFLEKWSYKEIADVFQIPESTASSLYSRIRKRLFEKYLKLQEKGE